MHRSSMHWLRELRFFAAVLFTLNLIWEIGQLPLYGIWTTGTARELAFAVLHCTAGDVLLGTVCLVAALLFQGSDGWPNDRFGGVALLTIAEGLLYTVYSEWHNTAVLHSWSYAPSMPTIAKIGISPLAQWLVIPSIIFWRIRDRLSRRAATF